MGRGERERGEREGEREMRQKHQSVASSSHSQFEPTTQVCALTRNRTLKLLVYWTTLQPTGQSARVEKNINTLGLR